MAFLFFDESDASWMRSIDHAGCATSDHVLFCSASTEVAGLGGAKGGCGLVSLILAGHALPGRCRRDRDTVTIKQGKQPTAFDT